MGWALVLLVFLSLTFYPGADGQHTWSQPSSSSVLLGGTIKLSCETQQSKYPIGWYQQKSGEVPHYVHSDGNSRGEGIPDRFTATRLRSTGTLTITNVQAEDEANYYCGSWNSNWSVYVFGGGTQLTVLGQPTVAPSLQVFGPSREQINSQKSVTLACLIENFYPGTIQVAWKADGKGIESGVQTTKPTKQGDKYLASSYLSMASSDFENQNEFNCQVTHEGKTFEKSVSRSGSC